MNVRRIPTATYRLQMHAGFDLAAAMEIVPYLKSLGISHVYTSSLLTAKPGSTHGYDVCDHSRLNSEIGTVEQLKAFSALLKENGMGLLLDVVPNHMSVGQGNAWWTDILENGPSSPYAGYFDIAWNDHPREALRGKVLLPILGTPYGEAIDTGLFRLDLEEGGFLLLLYESRLPIDPRTYGLILDPVLDFLKDRPETDAIRELQSILKAVRHLPPRSETEPARIEEGRAEIAIIKKRLKQLLADNPEGEAIIRRRLVELAADAAQLDRLIEAQAYRPCSWRVASDEINYRRFFDVNDLAALGTEKEEVFRDVHRLIFEWIEAGYVDGLRIDHPDGLFDPKKYLQRLRDAAPRSDGEPVYVVVEKILGQHERLRADWACDGTTGYEFANAVNGLFVNPSAEGVFTAFFESFTGIEESFEETAYEGKYKVLQSSMTSELHVLAGHLDRLAQSDRGSRDFTLNGLRRVLREVLCRFPIYRTYIDGEVGGVSDDDRISVRWAVRQARRKNPTLGHSLFEFLRDTLLLKDPKSGPATEEYRAAQLAFAGKFQQLSAPVMAKGHEDTALYTYNRLISLNEVGGDPAKFGKTPAEVHEFLRNRPAGGLSALSTHDTKRSEDVRARINVLSEMPREWMEAVHRWSEWNRPHRVELEDGMAVPDGNEEYLLYQTLVGTWEPEEDRVKFVGRIRDFMLKALHEAKVHTSWINPDAEYDQASVAFIERILDPTKAPEFLEDFERFLERVRKQGEVNSLAQALIRCTAPGVPDVYQGTEMFDFSLVDPDNRRPVDFNLRKRLLDERVDIPPHAVKLHVIATALRLRQADPELFERGDYRETVVEGVHASRIFAFQRILEGRAVITVVPRLAMGVDPWGETVIRPPDGQWVDAWTGEAINFDGGTARLADLFRQFPVALLVRREA